MVEPPLTAVDLPPGFRFHPTDDEIISYYLTKKITNSAFTAAAIGEADLNKCEPWDLPHKAKMGEKEWYFFCQRDRKYPTGMRTNRATQTGYWKATGKDKEIFKGRTVLAGMKKTLVFYKGRAPQGEKTNWVMHEFRLEPKFSRLPKATKDDWVVCRVFNKDAPTTSTITTKMTQTSDLFSSLPPLMNPAVHVPISGGFDDGGVKWRAPRPSECYMTIDTNDHQQQLPPRKLPLPTTMSGAARRIPAMNKYPPSALDNGFFSFDQLAANGTMAMTGAAPMECKMEQASWAMMSGMMHNVSSSVDNGCFEVAAMEDLDLWEY